MATVMCRTKFYARAFLLTSYRAHQWYFELCKLAKRVANDRLHQHCRDVSKQYRTTRSGLQMQACKAYFRTFVLLAHGYFGPLSRSRVFGFTMLMEGFFRSEAFFEQLFRTAGWNTFQNQKSLQQPTQPQLVYSALGGRKCGCIPRTQPGKISGRSLHFALVTSAAAFAVVVKTARLKSGPGHVTPRRQSMPGMLPE